jgi:hypothetical protein
MPRFINPAPFLKFEIDNESPGQVGGWIGWQIVRSYMKTAIFATIVDSNAKEIFENQNINPKK